MRCFLALVLSAASVFAADVSSRRAPSFSLPDSHQTQRDILDYRGKVLLIDFMQTSCPHCAKFTDLLEQALKKYPGKIAVLSVVIPPDTLPNVQNYITAHKMTSPILLDCGQVTGSYLQITSNSQNATVHFPHVFMIDPNGYIKSDFEYKEGGTAVFEGNQLFTEIEKILNAKK